LTRKEKKILGLTAAAHNMAHLFEGVLPPLIPILLLEFGTDYFHLGIVVSIFSYGFGQYIAGRLSDRYQPEKSYAGGLVIGTVFVFMPDILPIASD